MLDQAQILRLLQHIAEGGKSSVPGLVCHCSPLYEMEYRLV